MSETGHPSPVLRGLDHRTLAAIAAAVVGAVLGVGQLWFGQLAGVLAWRGSASTTGTVDEAAIVIWLAASATSVAAAVPTLLLKVRLASRRRRVVQTAMAVLGASLTVPVATAVAAVSQMYGGDLSQLRVTRLVVYGVVLGGLVALIAVGSQPAAWSLLYWLVIGWVVMCGSVSAAPAISPVLGHLDPGPEWSEASRQWQARMVLLAIAVVIGVALGAAARLRDWRTGGLASASRWTLPAAVMVGPGLMFAAYGAAAVDDGSVRGDVMADLLGAGLVAAVATHAGLRLASRAAPRPLRTM